MRMMCRTTSIVVALTMAASLPWTAVPLRAAQAPRLKVLVVHGPNLNLLGRREPQIYGTTTLDQINARLGDLAKEIDVDLITMQSNSEGTIVDAFQKHIDDVNGALINGAGLSFSSVSIHDVIKAMPFPVVEVHMSNIAAREEWRSHSIISPAVKGTIQGLGVQSYLLGLRGIVALARAAP